MRNRAYVLSLSALLATSFAAEAVAAAAAPPTRTIKVISAAGARGIVDGCIAWAQQNNTSVAVAVLDWGGNLISSQAMEGVAANGIDTALLKAKNALRWRRPSSETNAIVRRGDNLAPTFIMGDFPQTGAVPIVVDNQVIGSVGVSSGDGEKCGAAGIAAVFGNSATASVR